MKRSRITTGGHQQASVLDPETERGLTALVVKLTDPDAGRRRAALASVLATAIPPARQLLIERLIQVVRGGPALARRPAEEALVEFGDCAIAALASALYRTRSAGVATPLARALAGIGAQADPATRGKIMGHFFISLGQQPETAEAIGEALACLRAASSPDGAGANP